MTTFATSTVVDASNDREVIKRMWLNWIDEPIGVDAIRYKNIRQLLPSIVEADERDRDLFTFSVGSATLPRVMASFYHRHDRHIEITCDAEQRTCEQENRPQSAPFYEDRTIDDRNSARKYSECLCGNCFANIAHSDDRRVGEMICRPIDPRSSRQYERAMRTMIRSRCRHVRKHYCSLDYVADVENSPRRTTFGRPIDFYGFRSFNMSVYNPVDHESSIFVNCSPALPCEVIDRTGRYRVNFVS